MSDVSRLPGPSIDAWEWQYQGACRDLDTELFFTPRVNEAQRVVVVQLAPKPFAQPAPSSSSAANTPYVHRSPTESGAA